MAGILPISSGGGGSRTGQPLVLLQEISPREQPAFSGRAAGVFAFSGGLFIVSAPNEAAAVCPQSSDDLQIDRPR